ncbi:hypothetical protein ACEPAI_2986 [Sanghuangporus weigelae]
MVSARRAPKPPPAEVVYDDRVPPSTSASFADPAAERERLLNSDDPLTRALAPPPNETAQQRAARLAAAAEAKRISDMIDEELARQRAAEKKGQRPVKILLLGKSTTLKNFQLMNSPKAFRAERLSWRAVVQLNIVRSVRLILDAVADAAEAQGLSLDASSAAGSESGSTPGTPTDKQHLPPSPQTRNGNGNGNGIISPTQDCYNLITPAHVALRRRLLPLLDAEATLLARLMPVAAATGTSLREIENPHATTSSSSGSAPNSVKGGKGGRNSPSDSASKLAESNGSSPTTGTAPATAGTKEVSVFAGSAWKTAFTKVLGAGRNGSGKGGVGEDGIDWSDERDPTRVLAACGADLRALWSDARIRALLSRNKLRLEEMPGFFLDSLDRITKIDYVPTDDDILKARLKTLGVTEYRFTMKAGNAVSHDWRVHSFPILSGQRAAWVPFFDDMNAIIFLAPISCFDQVLMEDNSVNRLEDSVLLWKSVVSNQLLAKTNLVLFLNKCDVLRAKLRAGIRLGKYVISYGDRPNDFEHASEYLRRKFYNIHHEHSPEPRQFYSHFTSVTDTKTTSKILENVADMVLRTNLKASQLIG